MSRLEEQNAFSSECVPNPRQIRTLLALHTLTNSGDLVSSPPVTSHQEPGGLLLPAVCVLPSVQKCPTYTCSTVDMSAKHSGQSMHTSLFW